MRAMLLLLICCLVSSFTLPAVAAQPGRVGADLGLVELPVTQASSAPMVVFMSGDGGWAALDKGLSAQLQAHGMPVVGWSSLSYYWKKKTPDQATADLVRILTEYQSRWGRQRWLLVGFSFGAEIVPFVINRLPPAYRADRYRISNYNYYRLPPPPRGYYYTRVDNDVVLTAAATGIIASVIVGMFQ